MSISSYISYNKARDVYGELVPIAGFHRPMLAAGVRRIEALIGQKFTRHARFLQLICRSAMTNHGNKAHTILLVSFGRPLIALQNLSYAFQPFQERKVFIVHLEDAYAKWSESRTDSICWTSALIGTLCVCGIGILASMVHPMPLLRPHAFVNFYQ